MTRKHPAATIPPHWRTRFSFPQRQIHLDFHTSPHIGDVAAEFDAKAFARTMKRAHVDSVTVFAKCHHGMCYFPTRTGTPHPALRGRDLLGEMIVALHREGIRAPIYTTVAWEEDVARRFPQWRQMDGNGRFARAENSDHTKPPHPGGWHFNDWLNPEYQDYIEAHTREICSRYEIDGLFYDILFYANHAHHSDAAIRFREARGLLSPDDETFARFEAAAQEQFCARFTRLVRGFRPRATVFYNASLDVAVNSTVGGRVRNRHNTHIEIESLPSGFWGYYHFPRLARSRGRWGRPWIGMTGRFQRMWGDFGGIKPQAALEYECFRSQALGGGNSVGDQLPPRGTLDAAAYSLIGAVYEQCESAEPFYSGSESLLEVGVLTASYPGRDPASAAKSDEGAIQMCEEAHYEVAVLDELDPLLGLRLLILPDDTVITPKLYLKLKRFHNAGGKFILSHQAGRNASGKWVLDFLPLKFEGGPVLVPTYWRAREKFWPEMSASDRVCYSAGLNVVKSPGLRVLVNRVLPYFQRTDLKFCSHFQAPPIAKVDRHPAVVAGEQFVYFADPIFREYRELGNLAARDVWRRAMRRLVGPAMFGGGLPTTVLCVPRRRGRDLILTLLHYVPVRKAIELDVLEERMSFADEVLRLPSKADVVRRFGVAQHLSRNARGEFLLPTAKGRLLLEIPGYFLR